MITASQIESVAEISEPVVSVYVNTHNPDPSRHPRIPEDLAWLKKQSARLCRTLSTSDAKSFQRVFVNIEQFIEGRRPEEKALALFSGRKTWIVVPLRTKVENEIKWGKPATSQLFRLSGEHQCYGVVVIDHQGARFFRFDPGELAELGEKHYEIDESQWKRNELGHVASDRTRKAHGPDRDLFEHRVEAQYERLCRETADQMAALSKKHEFAGIFLVGPERLAASLGKKFSPAVAPRLFTVYEDLGQFSLSEICHRIGPLVAEHEQKAQAAEVSHILSAEKGTVTNADEILARLQDGSVRAILVAAGYPFQLRECTKCGNVNSSDRKCAICEGDRKKITMAEALARLAPANGVKVQFVKGGAAEALGKRGGIAGWLRQQKSLGAS
jgi:release factor family 10